MIAIRSPRASTQICGLTNTVFIHLQIMTSTPWLKSIQICGLTNTFFIHLQIMTSIPWLVIARMIVFAGMLFKANLRIYFHLYSLYTCARLYEASPVKEDGVEIS